MIAEKSNNLALQQAVRDKLAKRGTWVERGEIVQCLLLDSAYRNRPAIALANGVSHALHEIKDGGGAALAGYGRQRFWHAVADGQTPDEVMRTFDPGELGLEVGEGETAFADILTKLGMSTMHTDSTENQPIDAEPANLLMDPVDAEIEALRDAINAPKLPFLPGKAEMLATLAKVRGLFTSADSPVALRLQSLEAFLGQFPEG